MSCHQPPWFTYGTQPFFFEVHLSTLRLYSSWVPPASFSGGDGLRLKTPRKDSCFVTGLTYSPFCIFLGGESWLQRTQGNFEVKYWSSSCKSPVKDVYTWTVSSLAMSHCCSFPWHAWHVSLRPPEVTVLFMYLLPWAFGMPRPGQTAAWQIDTRDKVVVNHWFTPLRRIEMGGDLHQEASIQTSTG